jgi:hypothetical protein
LFLSRHPYDGYRSLADSGWRSYHRHPEILIDSATAFARLWNRIAVSWSELPVGFPAFHIKYEDMISGKVDFRDLESWLGIEIKENVALSAEVGGTAKRSQLSWCERLIIAREAAAGMNALGYSRFPQKPATDSRREGSPSRKDRSKWDSLSSATGVAVHK